MPKPTRHRLIWSHERGGYALYQQGQPEPLPDADDERAWLAWLEVQRSFAFEGRRGQITLLKERRAGSGSGYWYAYRRQGSRVAKRYLGRSAELSAERLERAAAELAGAGEAVPQAAAPRPAILAPKLQLPRLPGGLVLRQRLDARLDEGRACALTLVITPAGFGKTTLVASWLARQGGSAGWLALDEQDNDPARFWRYLISAAQQFAPQVGQAALDALAASIQPPFEQPPHELLLATLLSDLALLREPLTLVLEDYHLISSPGIHSSVAYLLEHLPGAVRLIMMTRSVPPLPLARLRARGQLCELSAADLRFSPEEIGQFFAQASGIRLDAPDLAQIERQTEGWAAGLRLLALGHSASSQPLAQLVASFSGSQRSVREYFTEEILQAQPPATQAFLLRTSALRMLNGQLCDAVMQSTDAASSAATLEQLASAQVFLEPLDGQGQWYRYHALFADAMRHEARRRLGDAALEQVLLTASLWYEQHAMRAEAIEAALQARAWQRAAALIAALIESQQNQMLDERGEFLTMRRWVEQIPEHVLIASPMLCFGYAETLLLCFMTEQQPEPSVAVLEHALDHAERGFRAAGDLERVGEVFAFRSLMIKHLDQIKASVGWANQALALIITKHNIWRAVGLSTLGTGALFSGQLDAAEQIFHDIQQISAGMDPIYRASSQLFIRASIGMYSELSRERGQLHESKRAALRLMHEAREVSDWDDIANALLVHARLLYEWNALDRAEEALREVQRIGLHFDDEESQSQWPVLLAQIAIARGDTAQARELLARVAQPWRGPQPSVRWYHRGAWALLAQLDIREGDLFAAQRWLAWRDRIDAPVRHFQHQREQLLAARLLAAQGQQGQALDAIAALRDQARQAGHTYLAIEAQAQLAATHAAAGQAAQAQQDALDALAQAAGEGYIRSFVDAGESMGDLLRSLRPAVRGTQLAGYLATLLRAFPGDPHASSALGADITPQEQRVLLLLAEGRSNPEMAERLVVSVNTIKAHLKSIYRKLDLGSRHEAIIWARQRLRGA